MCCECCFTTVIYNVMTITLSSCCMYISNTQSNAAQVGQGTSWRYLFSALIYKHIVVSLSKWLAPIPVCKIWTVYVCMKFTEVWYLDSAKQHPPLKFPDLQNVLNWLVSCRFCSQKFNLLMFLIGIADHAGPLVMHSTEWRKEWKKPKATLKHKTNLAVRPRFFYGPFLPIWYCINLSFWYLDAVCSAATGVLFVWIPYGIPYVKTTRCCK
jgi:hypothetical protein